ncbi:MAG: hypothetical protein GXY15_04670 [Candidatus Hydrogenedentes bacterium]|nr:hypothetical protein [Candidatus Hydrogenedentota bacterium]
MTAPEAPPAVAAPKRRVLVPVLAVVLPVALLFGVLEGAARVREIWVPPLVVDLGQGFDPSSRLFVPDPSDASMMITNPEKTVSFQTQRFARGKPPRTLRVFALGGSSVNYLDYEFPLLAEHGVPLADVEAAVTAAEPHGVPGETLFNDHCHLNPAGNALLARTYEKEILRALGAGK